MSISEEDSVRLQAIAAEEAEAIEAMALRIWPVCYAQLLSAEQIEYMLGWMYAPSRIGEEIRDLGIDYHWLRLGGETVGFGAVGPAADAGEVVLHKLYVLPEQQGRGIGSAALTAFEESAKASGAEKMSLRVNRGNASAIRVYEKNGFQRSTEVCSDIGGGFVMDDYVMIKKLA